MISALLRFGLVTVSVFTLGYGVYSCAVTQNNACLDAVAINDNILANNRQQLDIVE